MRCSEANILNSGSGFCGAVKLTVSSLGRPEAIRTPHGNQPYQNARGTHEESDPLPSPLLRNVFLLQPRSQCITLGSDP